MARPLRTRLRRALFALFAITACGIAAAYVFLDRLVVAALTPSAPFDPARVPPPPSYDRASAWSALPPAGAPARAADVFYVHPTSFIGAGWNASLDDATVNSATDAGATGIQATAFATCCAVYAPRYRQANLTTFLRPSPSGARAIDLAATDVVAAFRYYLEHHNPNGARPFIIAAHSQGSVVALRVLTDVLAGTPLRARLVAAYLIGGPLTEAHLASIPGFSACDSPTQTDCVVAFNARSPGYRGGLDFVEGPSTPPRPASPRVCVNPLTWRHDEAAAGPERNLGAVFYRGLVADPPRPRFTGARCSNGWLHVEPSGPIPRDFMSRLLDHALGDGNYHPVEYGLFFENLRENSRARVEAFRARAPDGA